MDNRTQVGLDAYEKWIKNELEKDNFVPVENFEGWKKVLESAAIRYLDSKKRGEFINYYELLKAQMKLQIF